MFACVPSLALMMATIPNLLSLRGRGRGRGRSGPRADGGLAAGEQSTTAKSKNDEVVQQTDSDASLSRMSAVEMGYLDDPFARDLASQPYDESQRRFPIINRGTYARTQALDRLVDAFWTTQPHLRKQIISLGAGSDTRFFRLQSLRKEHSIVYHELDFPTNTSRKLKSIRNSNKLRDVLGDPSQVTSSDNELHSPFYHLHAIDLRTLESRHETLRAEGKLLQIDPKLPTLLLSECCLVYLDPAQADTVVDHFVRQALNPETPVGIALYEPIKPFDAFGRVMVQNLAARGIHLQTLKKYSSQEAQRVRLKMCGFTDGQKSVDVMYLSEMWIGEQEKSRVSQVEMLDEVEELVLLLQHYCVAWGWRNGSHDGASIWAGWEGLKSQPLGD